MATSSMCFLVGRHFSVGISQLEAIRSYITHACLKLKSTKYNDKARAIIGSG